MRKLTTAALAYVAAVFLSEYLLPAGRLPYIAAASALLSLAALPLRGKRRLRALLITLCAAAGFLWSWGHWRIFEAPGEALDGQTVTVEARALDYTGDFAEYDRVYVRVTEAGYPAVKAVVYSYGEPLPELSPGDTLRVTMKLRSATERLGEETDYYTSRGVFLRGYAESAEKTGRSRLAFLYFPKTISLKLRETVDEIFPQDVAPLMKALLTGERGDMYGTELYDDMTVAGLLHVVAISGMHVAFLIGFVGLVCGSRKRTAAAGIALIAVFIPMTGGSASVIRAGFMQTLLLLAPLAKRENDPLTSLSAVLALLLVENPAAAANIGLQLSFAAMAGIILLTPRVHEALAGAAEDWGLLELRVVAGLTRFIVRSVASTVGAVAFTAPLIALYFGYVPLYAIVTNLLCIEAMAICFTGGFIVCLLGMLWLPLGAFGAWALAFAARYVAAAVHMIASWPWAALYTRNNLVGWWLASVYAMFIGSYALKGDRPYRPVLPLGLAAATLCILIATTNWAQGNHTGSFTVLDVGQGQCVAAVSGEGSAIIDCGSYGDAELAADAAVAYLRSQGRNSLDLLVLTHFHADHANGAARLLSRVEVGTLLIPAEDWDGDPDSVMAKTLAAAEAEGTEIVYVTEDTGVLFDGGMEIRAFAPRGTEAANENGVIVLVDMGDWEALITGDVSSSIEKRLTLTAELPDTELLVVGHHGSKYSAGEALLEAVKPETAVISVGYNTYGHPTWETLDRLAEYGVTVYRTDRDGDVTVRID